MSRRKAVTARTPSPTKSEEATARQIAPTLRTPTGERELAPGEVVHFGLGASSAHQLLNKSQEPVRYLVASNRVSPDAVEYPDSGQLSVMAFTESQTGEPLWNMRSLDES
ncbi:MAG: hypothetical protein JKY65_29795 [Planctomycetes bacterium]|nr:hypothetical protein [Planctomycetota bacterium]